MKASRVKWLAVGFLLGGLGLSCGEKGPDGVTRLSPRGVPYLEGVPVPDGFKMVSRQSTDYESGGQRSALHIYEGWADPPAIRGFYREQMPMLGWGRVSDQSVEGVASLRFEKQNEACTVEIRPTGLLNRTKINVTVSPFSRARTTTEPPRRSVP